MPSKAHPILAGREDAISLLQALLSRQGIPSFSSAQWDTLLPLLQQQRLSGFVYARLRRSPAWRDLPVTAQQQLSSDFQQLSIRAYRMEAELADSVQALAQAGIPVMLLKGAALARTLYAGGAERPVSDFDLLTPRTALQHARRILQSRGYQVGGLYWLPQWQQRYRAEVALVRMLEDGFRLVVELHWSLLEAPFYMDRIPMTEVWARAKPASDLPGALLPEPATLLIHACAHLALHHSDDAKWFWLLDIDQLARWPALDWAQVMAQAERWRLDQAVAATVQQAVALFATPLPEAVQVWIVQLRHDPAQAALLSADVQQAGRTWRKIRHTWQNADTGQRSRYAAWLALRSVLWLPEYFARRARLHEASGSRS